MEILKQFTIICLVVSFLGKSNSQCSTRNHWKYEGELAGSFILPSSDLCCHECSKIDNCVAWNYEGRVGKCELFSTFKEAEPSNHSNFIFSKIQFLLRSIEHEF